MFNSIYEGQKPFIQSGVDFNIASIVRMALDPAAKPYLSGGLNSTTNAALDKFIPEIWGEAVKDYMEKALVFGGIARDMSAMVAGGGDVIHLPKHTEITGEDLYGGLPDAKRATEISFSQVSTNESEYQLIVNQSNFAAIAVSDIAKAQSSYDVMSLYSQKLGYALAKKVDYYLAQKLFESVAYNYANNSDNDGAQAGNFIKFTTADTYSITKIGVSNMIQTILESDGSIEDYTLVLTPGTYSSLFKSDDFARHDAVGLSFGNEVPLISGFAGKLGGVNVIISNHFVDYGEDSTSTQTTTTPKGNCQATGTADESEHLAGYLVHKDALNIAYAAGMKSRVQTDYHLPSLSTRFVADTVYGGLILGNSSNNKLVFALTDGAA